jgi:(1->4)-alpha-D-glucan 1-alpha-D-glucosylmutase
VAYECKRLITKTALASELNVLAHALNRLSEGDRRARDFTLESLRGALREVVACFPIYRTYVSAAGAAETDRQMIELALARARRRNPAMEPSVFDFLRESLLPPLSTPAETDEFNHRKRLQFAMKFQQYTGPVQAKGVEDTAFYRYNVLLSLNEVGGDPQRFGGAPQQFHEGNRHRLAHWPGTMLATATHDTKRGEDARARLNVLSEIPGEWRRQVFRWARLNASHKTSVDGEQAPDRNDEYLFYQALLGTWPADTEQTTAPSDLVQRVRQYMLKAVKEAKVHTSWINPHEAYDHAVASFVDQTLAGPRAAKFLTEFLPFQQRIARMGMVNSLSQVVLKIVSPGAPDFYQGTELWDFSLVDPDNRRAVDYDLRQRLLREQQSCLEEKPTQPKTSLVSEMLRTWQDGRIKLWLTVSGLKLRKLRPRVFLDGEYLPLEAEGNQAHHVLALARRHKEDIVLAIVPRLSMTLTRPDHPLPVGPESWHQTRLVLPNEWSDQSFCHELTGEKILPGFHEGKAFLPVAAVLNVCPVALLHVESQSNRRT